MRVNVKHTADTSAIDSSFVFHSELHPRELPFFYDVVLNKRVWNCNTLYAVISASTDVSLSLLLENEREGERATSRVDVIRLMSWIERVEKQGKRTERNRHKRLRGSMVPHNMGKGKACAKSIVVHEGEACGRAYVELDHATCSRGRVLLVVFGAGYQQRPRWRQPRKSGAHFQLRGCESQGCLCARVLLVAVLRSHHSDCCQPHSTSPFGQLALMQ